MRTRTRRWPRWTSWTRRSGARCWRTSTRRRTRCRLRACPGCSPRRRASTPDAIAAVFEDRELSYAALDAHANRLAHHLIAAGVGPESIVALCVERSLEMVIGLLGILKAGAAYLPLDPSYPAERLSFMLADAGAGVVVTQQGLIDRLPVLAGVAAGDAGQATSWPNNASGTRANTSARRVVRLDADWGAIALRPEHAPAVRIEPGHAAYVIYTSGSTGTPKGVVVQHGALSNFLGSMQARFALQASDRLLAVTTVGFDIAALELYLPLLCGACVVVSPAETVKDVPALARLIGTSGARVMQATPTLWQALASHIGETRPPARPHRADASVETAASARPRRCAVRAADAGGRRGAERGPGRHAAWAGRRGGEPVRPDRDDGVVGGAAAGRRGACSRRGRDRACDRLTDLEHADLCIGRRS